MELKRIDPTQYVSNDTIHDPAKLRTALRQALGALIWLHQTRPDIGWDITKIATDAVEACKQASKALEIMAVYNKTIKFVQNNRRKIKYTTPGTSDTSPSDRWKKLLQLRLVVFTDAGFGSLTGSHSIEGSVTALAEVISRDGAIKCHGTLLDHRCAKIQRVCKSSLAAECHASLTAADQALWLQALLHEVVTGNYITAHLSPPTEFPLPDPFGPSPSDAEVRWQCDSALKKKHVYQSSCLSCDCHIPTALLIHHAHSHMAQSEKMTTTAQLLFRPLLLTDCCSLYSSILRIQPRSQDKCAKLILNQIRDLQTVLDISFVDNTCNLGDVETKHAGSLGILSLFLSSGHFHISFLGRKARKESHANQ